MRCHPPAHLPAGAIRREGEAGDTPAPAAPRATQDDANPLFQQAGIGLDDEG
jgi:hypothetical protein